MLLLKEVINFQRTKTSNLMIKTQNINRLCNQKLKIKKVILTYSPSKLSKKLLQIISLRISRLLGLNQVWGIEIVLILVTISFPHKIKTYKMTHLPC